MCFPTKHCEQSDARRPIVPALNGCPLGLEHELPPAVLQCGSKLMRVCHSTIYSPWFAQAHQIL